MRISASISCTALIIGLGPISSLIAQGTPGDGPKEGGKKGEDTVSLSVFEINASRDVGYLSTNAAEATRMNTPIQNIPMNVTVYNQQFIEDLLATDSSQLLAYEPSAVRTTENDGFLSRGSASVGTNFLDGFAQTPGFGSQPLANIERVEVLRGPAAVLYGSGGYGGTFNRITKQPSPAMFTKFRVIASDDHSFRAEFDENVGNLPVFGGDKLLFRINGILSRGTTWFGQRSGEDGIAPSLTWKIGPKTKVIFEYIYNWRDTQASWETPLHAGDPHGIVVGNGTYRVMPRNTNWGIPDDFRHNLRQSASADLRHSFSEQLQFRGQFQYETRGQLQQETVANGTTLMILKDTAMTGRYWRKIPRTTRNYRTRDELVWDGKTGPFDHKLLLGIGWAQQYDRTTTYQSAASGNNNTYADVTYAQFLANPALAGMTNLSLLLPVNLFDRGAEPPVPPIDLRPPARLNSDVQTYTASEDYYVNDVFSVFKERFFIMAGARHTDFQRKTITWNSGATLRDSAPTDYSVASATTSSFGAVWHLNASQTLSLYGNLNSSFSPQYNINPDGSRLEPETGKQKEVGLRFQLLKGRMQGLLTYFDLLQDNVTIADPDRLGYFIQQSGQRSTGFEFTLNGRVTDNWLVMGGVSDTDARNDLTGVAKDLSPHYKVTLFNNYHFTVGFLKGLSVSLGSIYTGERPLTLSTARGEPNWGPLPSWWRHDLIIGYKMKSGENRVAWNFSVKVSNVLDNTDIYYVGAWHRYTIEPGREWQAAAGLSF